MGDFIFDLDFRWVSGQRQFQRNHFTFWIESGLRPNSSSAKKL